MGAEQSTTTRRRSSTSSRPPSKIDVLETISSVVQEIHKKIESDDNPEGNDLYFEQLNVGLVKIKELKNATKKQKTVQKCNALLDDIAKCQKMIQDKVEMRERNLDLSSVESNSFVPQSVPQSKDEAKRKLLETEERMKVLDLKIRKFVLENDIANLVLLEEEVQLLYRNLEEVKDYDEFKPKKEKLAQLLIKFGNKINVVKKRSKVENGTDTNDGHTFSKPKEVLRTSLTTILNKIEADLPDLEVRCLTFEDTESDSSYVSLFTQLQQFSNLLSQAGSIRNAKLLKQSVDKNLEQLIWRAKENDKIIRKELGAIVRIEKDVTSYKTEVDNFAGNSEDAKVLEELLRASMGDLSQLESSYKKVALHKGKVIKEIELALRNLKELQENPNKKRQSAVLSQVRMLQSSWDNLSGDVTETVITKEIFEAVQNMASSMRSFLRQRESSINIDPRVKKVYSSEIMDQLVKELAGKSKEDVIYAELDPSRFKTKKEVSHEALQVSEALEKVRTLERQIFNTENAIRALKKVKGSEEYSSIEAILQVCKSELESVRLQDEEVVTAHEKAMERLRKAFQQLKDRGMKNEELRIRNVIMSIDNRLHSINKEVDFYTGTVLDKEYKDINLTLDMYRKQLQGIDLSKFENLKSSKAEVLAQIEALLLRLCEKASKNNVLDDDKEIKSIQEQVLQISKKIDCFSGTYKNIQYNLIEKQLQQLQDKLELVNSADDNIKHQKLQAKSDVSRLVKILEERSMKPTPVPTLEDNVRESLQFVEVKIASFRGTESEYQQINNELKTCKLKILSLSDNRRQNYLDKMQEMQTLLQSRAVVIQVEEELDLLESNIGAFQGFKNDSEFEQLNKTVSDLMSKVDKLAIYRSKDIMEVCKNFKQKLNQCFEMLHAREQDPNEEILTKLEKVKNEALDIVVKIEEFSGSKNDPEYSKMDETLIQLFLQVDHINIPSPKVKTAKQDAIKEIRKGMKLLEDKAMNNGKPEPQPNGTENTNTIKIEVVPYVATLAQRKSQNIVIETDLNNFERHSLNLNEARKMDDKLKRSREQLDNIDMEFSQLATKINTFVDTKESVDFYLLKESLTKLTEMLDNVKEPSLEERRKLVLRKINEYYKLLYDKSNRAEKLFEVRNMRSKLKDVKKKIEEFDGGRRGEETEINNILVETAEKLEKLLPIDDAGVNETKEKAIKELKELRTTWECKVRSMTKGAKRESVDLVKQVKKIKADIAETDAIIRKFKGTTDSESYDDIEARLLDHKNILECLKPKSSKEQEALSSAFRNLEAAKSTLRDRAEVNDTKRESMRRRSVNRSSIRSSGRRSHISANKVLDIIVAVDSDVNQISKYLQGFLRPPSDQESAEIQEALNKNKQRLDELEVANYGGMQTSKLEVLKRIAQLQDELGKKMAKDEGLADLECLKSILKKVKQVEMQVSCFTGTYKGKEYLEIELQLNGALERLDQITDNNPKIAKAKKKSREGVLRLLQGLEEKSAKPQAVNQYEDLRHIIESIKVRVDNFQGNEKNKEYYDLVRDITRCNQDDTSADTSDQKYIQSVKLLQELLVILNQKVNGIPKYDPQSSINALQQINDDFLALQGEVSSFKGKKEDPKYAQLEDSLSNLKLRVDKVRSYQNTSIRQERNSIRKHLGELLTTLDVKAGVSKSKNSNVDSKLALLQHELAVLNESIQKFNGRKDDPQHAQLDEALVHMYLKVDDINVAGNEELVASKRKFQREIQRNMKLLQDIVNRPRSANSYNSSDGTQV